MTNTVTNATNNAVNSAKEIANTAGFREIKDDLNTLKDDAAATMHDAAKFARNLKNESGHIARDSVEHLKSAGQTEFYKMEERVREKPGQSVALAFCAGLVFSYILGGRR